MGLQLGSENYKAGSYIVIEGKKNSRNFYIIRQGHVQLSRERSIVDDHSASRLGPGDFFGVVSCMSQHPRIETVMALSDVSLISILREQFGDLIQKNAPVAMKIIKQFSVKLRYYDQSIARLSFQDEVFEHPMRLFDLGEFYFKKKNFQHAAYCYQKYIQHNSSGNNISASKMRLQALNAPETPIVDPQNAGMNRSYANDDMIFSEHEPGNELYIIQQGKVKITKVINDNEIMLAVLQPGDIFGEMALLDNKPRSASAIAYGDVVMLTVNRSNFEQMVISKPQIATRLIQLLSERIWIAHKQLSNIMMRDPLGRIYDTLLTQVLKNRITIEHRKQYTFEFGAKELIKMVGLSIEKGEMLIRKLLENNKFRIVSEKLHVDDLEELEKQAQYFVKMEEMERKREASSRK